MPKLDFENDYLCPFSKHKIIKYDTIGPNYTPVPVMEQEYFNNCVREKCMLYHLWDDTEECLMGR